MTLNRSAELGDFVGRTLDRRASRYDVPSRVTDDGLEVELLRQLKEELNDLTSAIAPTLNDLRRRRAGPRG